MDLKIKDIVTLLNVPEKTVYQWIKKNEIPFYKINHQYRFSRAEINEWILKTRQEFSSSLINLINNENQTTLSVLIERGGIINLDSGESVPDILRNAVERIKLPENLTKDELLGALLNREELMPTAIGSGIAIPHPRNPIVTDGNNSSVSICYLSKPIEFGALDNQPVHTLFILITANPRMHLEALSKISYLCQNNIFLELLKRKAKKEEILTNVIAMESDWRNKGIKN